MTSTGTTMNGLDINEITGERIKAGLIESVKKRLNSDNVELCIEHGSKKGLQRLSHFKVKSNKNCKFFVYQKVTISSGKYIESCTKTPMTVKIKINLRLF